MPFGPFSAQIQRALKAYGLTGSGYATGDVPTWDAATGTFTPSSGAAGSFASVSATTWFRGGDGTAAAPTFSFTGEVTKGMYSPAAATLGWSIASALELQLTAGALSPGASDGSALGTTALMWSDLFLAAGGVINFNNGNMTLTHSAGQLTVAGGLFSLGGNSLIGVDSIVATGGATIGSTSEFAFGVRGAITSPADQAIRFYGQGGILFTSLFLGSAGGATTTHRIQKKITGIADNTATAVFTVTIPNANHAAGIRLQFLSSNGDTDAFESSRCASGMVVVARTTGANAVAAAAAIDDAAIATVAAGATHTLAYGVSAIAGAVGDPNTFTITVTIDDSGNLGSNQVVAVAELLNAESTGITVA